MAIRIEIYTTSDDGPEKDQVERSMEAIGFTRRISTVDGGFLTRLPDPASVPALAAHVSQVLTPRDPTQPDNGPQETEGADIIASQQADVEQAKAATARERGKPGEGRARRTKAEIAEDEAADAADAFHGTTTPSSGLALQSGDERINPDEEQDTADETAEKLANAKSAGFTTEDLRAAVAAYQKKHGMAAAVALVKEGGLIGCTIDAVPQERLAAVIEALGTSAVSVSSTVSTDKTDKPTRPEYAATKEGLMKAMLDYALKFDGTNDVSKANNTTMPATMEDCPKIFVMRFGEAVNSLGKVPADGYAQAITDVQDATEKNPFKRAVKGGA